MFGLGALNQFISGAIWLAAVIALGFTGWRAIRSGYFQAVSQRYSGRGARNLGLACLIIGAVVGLFFLYQVLQMAESVVLFGQLVDPLFFFLGAAVGGWFTYRYYAHHF
ncbi:MAG TPA: hypothetical protein VMV93_15170 [Chloroflexota bacterium]|nr:hypothetical protein [Chloroflexota bacterium]